MKLLKKVSYCLVLAFIAFCGFTLNVKADDKFAMCTYKYNDTSVGNRTLTLVYRNKEFYLLADTGNPNHYWRDTASSFKLFDKLKIDMSYKKIDEICPNNIQVNGYVDDYSQLCWGEICKDSIRYDLSLSGSDYLTFLSNLSCTYKRSQEDMPDLTLGYVDGYVQYEIISFLGGSDGERNTKQLGIVYADDAKKLYGFGAEKNGGAYLDYEALQAYKEAGLIGGNCPNYLIYNPDLGFYVSKIPSIDSKKIELLRATAVVNPATYYYYEIGASAKNCPTDYSDTINEHIGILTNTDSLIKERIQDGKLDSQAYDEYYGQRTKANNDLNSFGNCVDKDLKETLEKLIQSVGSNLDQAVAASTIMTSSEKTVANNNSNAIKTSAKQMATLDDPIDISGNISCDSLLGSPNDSGSLYSLINTLFRYIQIIAPILLIVFGGVDFGKAVLSSDQEELKKAQARFIKRCIAALALFFLPYMVKWLMEQIMTHTGIIDWDACMPK